VDTQTVLKIASDHLMELPGQIFNVLAVTEPVSTDAAINLSKIVSKLSPLVGNLIEFNTVDFLNKFDEFKGLGTWKRQDPGFPDAVFEGTVSPTPGFEIKAWFPLATEITARFKDSQNHFLRDETYVVMLAWFPEYVIYGKPQIIDIVIVSGASVAKARDDHYHNPPDYLVLEPEDTTQRTVNLQQTNTNGYKFQGTKSQFRTAQELVASWGEGAGAYSPTPEYQRHIRLLIEQFPYRLDTNFAKMDRISHEGIEEFKARVLSTDYKGMTIAEWSRLFSRGTETDIASAISTHLNVEKERAH